MSIPKVRARELNGEMVMATAIRDHVTPRPTHLPEPDGTVKRETRAG